MNPLSRPHAVIKSLRGSNLYLIGMMGSGKSQTGPLLAKSLSYSFIDADSVVEELVGMKIPQIFELEGESEFRKIETQVLNAIGQCHSLVVATGGGVVTCSENWGVLHQGISIWLDPGSQRLWHRLKADSAKRPLMQNIDSFVDFEVLVDKRINLYREADLHIRVEEELPDEVASQILNGLDGLITAQGD